MSVHALQAAEAPGARPALATPAVHSYNEWDPLEEVIVGIVEDAVLPEWDTINEVTVPPGEWEPIVRSLTGEKGRPYPPHLVAAARRAVEGFVHILEAEGVTVRRPSRVDHSRPFGTPDWRVECGFCAANPRDLFLVIGDEIIEAPMADRSRYFETWAYRPLLKEYFKAGARWTAAPRPQLLDDLYDQEYRVPEEGEPLRFLVTELEPTFDAAEFARCGRDLFTQRSQVTNELGIEWLQRHLGDGFRIHLLETRDPQAIHLDSTFVPLAPGKVLVNPEYLNLDRLPPALKKWDLLVAPREAYTNPRKRGMLSEWIHLNVLSLDGERVIVEKSQEPLIRALKDWGFKPIPCAFEDYYPFVGAFHCATLDIRRRGTLESYF